MCMTAHLQRRTNNFLKFNRKAHRTKNLNIKPLTTFIYKFSEDSFFFLFLVLIISIRIWLALVDSWSLEFATYIKKVFFFFEFTSIALILCYREHIILLTPNMSILKKL